MQRIENSPASSTSDLGSSPPDSPLLPHAALQQNEGWTFSYLYNNPLTRYLGGSVALPLVQNAILINATAAAAESALSENADREFKQLFDTFAPQMEKQLHQLLLSYCEKQANITNYLNSNEEAIAGLIHYLVVTLAANLVTSARKAEEGPLSLIETLKRPLVEIVEAIKSQEAALLLLYERAETDKKEFVLRGVPPQKALVKRDLSLKEELNGVTKKVLHTLLPGNGSDLPVTNFLWIRSFVFSFIQSMIADLVLQICHCTLYPKLNNFIQPEEALANWLGKQPVAAELPNEQKAALILKNVEVEGDVQKFKKLCQMMAEDLFQTYFKPDALAAHFLSEGNEEVKNNLINFFTPIYANESVKEAFSAVLSEMFFKILAHQTEMAGSLLTRYADIVVRCSPGHLKGDYAKLENAFGLEEKEKWVRHLREKFKPLSKELLENLCSNTSEQLFSAIPTPYRKMVYSLLEEKILPDLLLRTYRETKDSEFQKGTNLREINAIFSVDVRENHNFIPGFCSFLAKWSAAYIPNYLYLESGAVARQVTALIPEKYLQCLGKDPAPMLERNFRHIADMPAKEAMEGVEQYLEAFYVQVFAGFIKKVDKQEYRDTPNAHALFTSFLEKVIQAANRHLITIEQVKQDAGYLQTLGLYKSKATEGFFLRNRLHPAMQGEANQKQYLQDISELFLILCDLRDPDKMALPAANKKAAFEKLKKDLLPALLKNVFKTLSKPQTIDKILSNLFKEEKKFIKDLEKTEFTDFLGVINNLGQTLIPQFLRSVKEKPPGEWVPEQVKLLLQISEIQNKIYAFQTIDDRLILQAQLLEIKNNLVGITKEKIPVIESLLKGPGGDEGRGLVTIVTDLQYKYTSYQLSEADKNDPFNKICGELVLNFVKLLPHNNVLKTILHLKNVRNLTEAVIGKCIRQQANDWTFLKIVNKSAENGVSALSEREVAWVGAQNKTTYVFGHSEVVPEGQAVNTEDLFVKKENDVNKRFIPDEDQAIHFSKEPKASNAPVKNELMDLILKFVDEAIRSSIRNTLTSHFERFWDTKKHLMTKIKFQQNVYRQKEAALTGSLQDRFTGASIKAYFVGTFLLLKIDQITEAVAAMYHTPDSLLRVLCNLIAKFLEICFTPVSYLAFSLIHLYVRQISQNALKTLHMAIHENFLYEAVDELFRALFNMPDPEIGQPQILADGPEFAELKKNIEQLKSQKSFLDFFRSAILSA